MTETECNLAAYHDDYCLICGWSAPRCKAVGWHGVLCTLPKGHADPRHEHLLVWEDPKP